MTAGAGADAPTRDAGCRVSVIVACYNAAPFLERCVASILSQTLPDIEVILVDDCSTDSTFALAQSLAAANARLRVDRLPRNGGPGAARNRGFDLATGRWVAIVDSDDLLHPARFATLIAAADATGADMIADDLLVFQHGSSAPAGRFLKPADQGRGFELDLAAYLRRSILYGPEPNPGFLKPIIRRTRWLESGVRYDETLRIAEDDDLAVRLLLAGLRYRILALPFYFYRKHDASISHRMSVATIEAMRAANKPLVAAIVAARPALERLCAARSRALDGAAAFERAIAALKQRRFGVALRALARQPGAWPLLRMPVAGALAKLRRSKPRAAEVSSDSDEAASLIEQAGAAIATA